MWADSSSSTLFPRGAWILLLALAIETAVFSVLAPNFFTLTNFFEVLRFSVELGLLSIALTPIIIAGGIDLSVGSTVGLVAIVFGVSFQNAHLSVWLAVVVALIAGGAAGAINAFMIAGLRLPALIATLGTYALYRGIAEGVTHGSQSYTGFPESFLFLGQGYLWRMVPAQTLVSSAVSIAYLVLLHFSVFGRTVYAIGFNAEGALFAGIPVRHRLAVPYLLSGIVSALAAVIYVAHLGLAKPDLGTGFELQAIAAVVLGGTSVFGGRGSLAGTLLGLFLLCVLQDGMHLLALPSELTGVLTGALLLVIVSFDKSSERGRNSPFSMARLRSFISGLETHSLTAAGLLLLAVLAVPTYFLVRYIKSTANGSYHHAVAIARRPVIAVMPKAKGDPYFMSTRAGAEEAARFLNVELIWDGPTSLDASQQNELVEDWITRGVDAIVVAVENKGSISTVLRKARQHDIAVLTWDSDAEPDARDFFLNQATPEGIANTLTDEAAHLLPNGGQFAIITGPLTAENQNEWIDFIKKRVASNYPKLTLATIQPSDDDRDKAFNQAQTILKVFPAVKLIMAISAPAVPGAAEAVQQSGRKDVDVIGLSLPSICKPYIDNGTVQAIALWNTRNLGYLTVYAGWLDSQKKISEQAKTISAGRLGILEKRGDEIILGSPLLINRANIDHLGF